MMAQAKPKVNGPSAENIAITDPGFGSWPSLMWPWKITHENKG